MKKIISILTLLLLITVFCFTGNVYADSLDTVDVTITKELVRPGEEVKVNIEFGTALGSYTFDVAYDNNIFEYVSAEGGTSNDLGTKVRVVFYDSTGGTNPRNSMNITFKAKDDITTSNPTEFNITAEGLANSDASVTYDDITTPITKNVTVEPEYVDYTLSLETVNGTLIKGEENDMKLSYSSPMGRYYEKARLVAEKTSGTGDVKLLADDSARLEHDIIQSGWGEEQGYEIGGKDVSQVLNVRGVFSEVGDYKIILKLIDRGNSDTVIAEKTFDFTVEEKQEQLPPEQEGQTDNEVEEEITPPQEESTENEIENKVPEKLPKTGINIYIPICLVLIAVLTMIVYYNRKSSKK